MGKKRKLAPKSTETAEPPLKQHQSQPQPQLEPEHDNAAEEEYEEVEEEVEVEQEEEEDEEQQQDDEQQQQQQEEDEEPIQKLIEPFGKEQIMNLLCEAATKHRDVADRIRKVADGDAVHRKIFVHGLGWDTTAATLINAFSQYGEIEDCKAVTDKVSGKSKGYGFILFKTRRGARKALKEPQKKIGNRMTACQLASIGPVQQQPVAAVPQLQQPAQPAFSAGVSEYTQRKIYVSNVGAELDPQKLFAFFSRFGEIEEGPLGLDKVTGKPKGFCLFVYKSAESAKRALEEPHKEFEGHILHCQRAIDGPKQGKLQQLVNPQSQRPQFQRNDSAGFVGGSGGGVAQPVGHLMAPAGPAIGFNQSATAAQALNPALGQALTALLASQGTLGLTNLLGSLGTSAAVNPVVPAAGHGVQGGYNVQPNISPGVIGGYGNQVGLQAAYPNQQIGQGGSGRGQYGGVPPYIGH
ncbi:UBP1-associated protein 2A isoform X1 [Gastrolobium bilobum]|uniref:UBP1-associated protein 2A isoform X1 n=1 Tax=Gastrolobium bilobum TaxID=150636 RepID=UPI002AAF3A1A|nr:UBP1-associated protein 2A isoform X1 [Gastrolobium bilobum]XP_061355983.1 UBP1-associated protein 2A isoform X1 [Gastrolobium bilobum]XP_061355984.1 UBP1-associated protein 2A isoform X1 [Gastrolobium bilobum]XP_061355985.1 UBP1-associated protein 2A isoform X1 [Gastrolobium bilobum]XP_061355986.1 UBP1-associated protein 2A isoform X1 [Gastrolobium bilobum]XP_061355987.1 UBP1-associated protein 2A isoform X1 [Gastrolobium bilobum]